MATIKLFKGWRPVINQVKSVASRPYDVLSSAEARVEAAGNPYSFLHVIKPEIDLPEGTDVYDHVVYQKGYDNFKALIEQGIFKQDTEPSLYLYRLTMDGRSQTGIVGLAASEDYVKGVIRIHELTRPVKEEDRKNIIRYSDMIAEPVFFAYPRHAELDQLIALLTEAPPVFDFLADDEIRHELWQLPESATTQKICDLFQQIPHTYVADGHHRTAAAALVGQERAEANSDHTGSEPYNYFLAVHFPDDQLHIMDYNRVVSDLNGMTPESFLDALNQHFDISPRSQMYRPGRHHELSMYLAGKWYALQAKTHTYDDTDPIRSLDVTVLSNCVLSPLLGITDLRRDKRIDFVGGIRGLEELERRVDQGDMLVAFALYPVSMAQLMRIADSGQIMPPKTTWFEPKLRSGLVVYRWIQENKQKK